MPVNTQALLDANAKAKAAAGLGNGGADYNTLDTVGKQQMQDNRQRAQTDATYRQSEIQRANDVIANRNAQGMDTAAQTSYLNWLNSLDQRPATPATPTAQISTPTPSTTPQPMVNQNTAADYIKSAYDNNYAAQAQKLKAARDAALAGLAGQEDLVNQQRTQSLNAGDVMAERNRRLLRENMAQNGLNASGDSISAQIGQDTAAQQVANQTNMNAANQLKQILAQRDAINNNANADDLALMQSLQAQRDQAMAGQYNVDRQFGLQEAGLTGTYNGQQTLAAQNQLFNQGIAQAGVTGMYGGQQTLAARDADRNYGLSLGQLSGVLPNGQQTLAAQNQAFNQGISTAQLTGKMPDGTPTTAYQQQQLQNLWNVADQTGTIPDQLADMYGIPRGTQSIDAKLKLAQTNYYNDHGQYYAGGGSGGSGGSAAARTAATNDYTSQVYDQLNQLDPSDYEEYLNSNRADIVRNIGQPGFDKLKASVLADSKAQSKQDATDTANKQKTDMTIRDRAISAAQKDARWADPSQRTSLIQEYESYYQ